VRSSPSMDMVEMQTTSNRCDNVGTLVTVHVAPEELLMDEDEDVSEELLEKWKMNLKESHNIN